LPDQIHRRAAQNRTQRSLTCGVEGPQNQVPENVSPLIVGGVESEKNRWPWMAALFIDDAWFCGGSLISENFVLTAAHCVDGASYFDIMLGAHNVRDSTEPHRVEITSYNGWTHPLWNSNDLSVCLPNPGEVVSPGDLICVTGWGKPSDSAGGISPVLREVCDIPVMSNADCNAVYGIVSDGAFCVDTSGGRGSCNGDSGGPAIMRISRRSPGDRWKEVGVVSFGASAGCEAGLPAAFTRVEYYLDWILEETGLNR